MDHVLAKVKGLRKKPYLKLISDHTLYTPLLSISHCIPYNSDHNLDEDAWFRIKNIFSQQGYCIDLVKGNFDSKDYDNLTKDQFSKIAYLFAIQGDDLYFQKITPSLFLKRKMIGFSETAKK